MYQVTEEYIEQMMKRGTRRRLTGSIGSVAFTGNDVVQNSFSITGRATEESDTKIGGVYLGQLEMTFVPSFINKVARDEYKDKEVSLFIGLYVPEEENAVDGWVDIPVGVFTLQSPKISKQGITVSGYDHMKKLDKPFNIDITTATIYGFMSYIAQNCSVTLGNTQEEITSLPNGAETLGLHEKNDIETYRDLLYWVAQTCGCFACADREGNIVLRKFGTENNVEFDENHRDADVIFSGYTTKWTGISVVDIDTNQTKYYGLEVDDGLTMNLGANPLLQVGSLVAIERRRRAVLEAVSKIQYTPFYCNSARDPIFELGDEINFSGGLSGNSTGVIMAASYSLDNYTFEGYGDDPDLANSRNKTDKSISGLINETTENETVFYNFANLEPITFGSEQEVTIASLAFTSAQKTTVKIMHEFIFDFLKDLAVDSSYEIRYYLDDELIQYTPMEALGAVQTFTAGTDTGVTITRDLFYVLKDVDPNIRHTWKVKMIAHDISSVTIGVNHAHVTLEGQRLYGDKFFDGFIEAEDLLSIIPFGYLSLVGISDEAIVNINAATIGNASDNIGLFDVDKMTVIPIAEGEGALSPHIFLQTMFGYILTEAGDILTTENGDRLIL